MLPQRKEITRVAQTAIGPNVNMVHLAVPCKEQDLADHKYGYDTIAVLSIAIGSTPVITASARGQSL